MVSYEWLSPEKKGTPGLSSGTLLAFGALLVMPAMGMVFGFVSGMLGALLYNRIAKIFGGLKVDFKIEDESNRTYKQSERRNPF